MGFQLFKLVYQKANPRTTKVMVVKLKFIMKTEEELGEEPTVVLVVPVVPGVEVEPSSSFNSM
jgi:hypothetical protein